MVCTNMFSPSISLNVELPLDFLWWPYHERVAFLVGRSNPPITTIDVILPSVNSHHKSYAFFGILSDDYESVKAKVPDGMQIVGVLHTHLRPDEDRPSQEDLDGLPEGWLGAIYHLPSRRLLWYHH